MRRVYRSSLNKTINTNRLEQPNEPKKIINETGNPTEELTQAKKPRKIQIDWVKTAV
jgi:hypothetical protein